MTALSAKGDSRRLREAHAMDRHIACARIAGYVDGSTEMQNERIGALLEKTFL